MKPCLVDLLTENDLAAVENTDYLVSWCSICLDFQ